MRVLRIAHSAEGFSGEGMYCSGLWGMVGGDMDYTRHPMPYEDTRLKRDAESKCFLLAYADHNRYGFEDVRQLRSWLYSGELCERLELAGAVVFVLEVPEQHVAVGSSQVVFDVRCTRLVEVASLVQLFNGE